MENLIALKIYIFSGLVLHKIVWEVLRKKSSDVSKGPSSFSLSIIKAVKVAILVGILVQVWLPDVLPVSTDTFAIRISGVVVYTIGLITALAARFQLGTNWSNIETGQVLDDQKVVSNGIYGYIRHPIYSGDLLLLMGLELALNSWLVIGVALLAPIVLMKAVSEERMLERELVGYETYCRQTKRFIPFVV